MDIKMIIAYCDSCNKNRIVHQIKRTRSEKILFKESVKMMCESCGYCKLFSHKDISKLVFS